jgi:hypothetical protein
MFPWGGIHQMFTQFFYEYSFYNSSPSQSRCTKFFNTRKNYGRIVERFCGPLTGRAGRKELWKNCRNIFGNLFTILPSAAVYPSEETTILRRFCGKIVEEFGACQIRGKVFLTAGS